MQDDTLRTQIAENMRFYADMRFKQLTLLLAWLTLVAGGIAQFSEVKLATLAARDVLIVAAALVTAVFWIMEIRSTLYWCAHRDVSPDLWPRISGDSWRLVNATYAIFLLHLALYSFWAWFAWKSQITCVIVVGLCLLGLLVFMFGVHSYFRYLKPGATLPKNGG